MRLEDFKTIEEIVEVGMIEFQKRSTAPSIKWIPSRQNVYTSQCKKYSEMLLTIVSEASENNLIESEMNPSQFIKAAQDFQLSARMAGIDKETVLDGFISLANIGMRLKRHYYNFYLKRIPEIELFFESQLIKKANLLNGLLRAYSEALYFDDHTVSGEFYGDIHKNNMTIVVRSYNRLCPSDFLNCFDDFQIQRIITYCGCENGQVDFDCLGNILYLKSARPQTLCFYGECFLTNGQCIVLKDVNAILSIIDILEAQLKKILDYYYTADKQTQGRRLLESAYYAFCPILNIIGYNWRPSNSDITSYLDSLTEKVEFDKVSESTSLSIKEQEKSIRRVVDPRLELLGG